MTTATATRKAPAAMRLAAPALTILRAAASRLLCLLPGLLTVYFAFNSGGHGPDIRALALLLLALLLMARIAFVRQPFAGFSRPLAIAGGALLLFAVWTWLSSAWSDAPARSFEEFQRVALYLAALVLFGSFVRRKGGAALMLTGLAVAILAVCVASLATALYPDVLDVAPALAPTRLAYPISYWNGLGILAAVGTVLLLHFACDERGAWPVRVLGAAGVPVTALTIYFTFSRGATAAIVLGVVAYLLLGRSRGAIAGVIATAPTTYIAIKAGHGAELLGTVENRTVTAALQGHDVAGTLVFCCVAAALCRAALVPLDNRLSRIRLQGPKGKETAAAAAAGLALLLAGTAIAIDVPGRVDRAWDSFTKPERGHDQALDARKRLGETSLGSRRDHWDVALAYYRGDRLRGAGAGTFETQWLRSRPTGATATDAHSLYIEVLSELGLVGFALLVTAIGALLVGLLLRARGRRRPLYAAVFAASLMWAAHAGVDWHWELPAVSLWMFALSAMALARTSPTENRRTGPAWPLRAAAGLLCLFLAISAVRMVVSADALDRSISAFKAGHCTLARDQAQTSLSASGTQPQAAAVLGYCDSIDGRDGNAIRGLQAAVRLDPDHWRYRYGLALVRARGGQDPRRDLALARRLNPRGGLLFSGAAAQLGVAERGDWRRVATMAEPPID